MCRCFRTLPRLSRLATSNPRCHRQPSAPNTLCGDVALLCAPSPRYIFSISLFFKRGSTRSKLPLLMSLFLIVKKIKNSEVWRLLSERQRRRRSLSAVASARFRVDFGCRIEPQVPPTAKRAKHVTRRRYPPLRALSGLYLLDITFWLKHSSTRRKLPLLMSLFF